MVAHQIPWITESTFVIFGGLALFVCFMNRVVAALAPVFVRERFVVLSLVAVFALTGCMTLPQRRQVGLIEGVVMLPFALVGGVVTVVTGYNVVPTEADIRIGEYATKQYGYGTRDYYVCLSGAYGSANDRRNGGYNSFDDYYRRSSGLPKGRRDREQLIWQACETVGRAIGNQGM